MPMTIVVPDIDGWDNDKEEFVKMKGATIVLEHSLISIQKWESKWHKPYINSTEKTIEEAIDYIRCMTINSVPNPEIYRYIPKAEMIRIESYIKDPMTATTFGKQKRPEGSSPYPKEIITAEIIYYLMIEYGIPVEYRKWHLNQLMALIRVCQLKSKNPDKMSKKDVLALHRAQNAARRRR